MSLAVRNPRIELTYSDIIETLRAIIQEKNADEVFQNALWSSYTADPKVKADGVVPVSQQDAKKDADQGESLDLSNP